MDRHSHTLNCEETIMVKLGMLVADYKHRYSYSYKISVELSSPAKCISGSNNQHCCALFTLHALLGDTGQTQQQQQMHIATVI